MNGNLSNYPQNYDGFVNVTAENKTGYFKSETKVIPESLELNLSNYAKKNTISICGFTEVFSQSLLESNKFYVSNYKIPVYTKTGIDFEIGNKIKFHSDNANSWISIGYTSVGSKVSAILFNWLFDCIYSIQHTIGTLGKYKDLEIGNYKNIGQYISHLLYLIQNHKHDGTNTPLLNENAIPLDFLKDEHFDDNANIAQYKIEDGQVQWENDKDLPAYTLNINTPPVIDNTYKCIVIPENGHDNSKYPIYPYFENNQIKIKCAKENVKFDYIIYK